METLEAIKKRVSVRSYEAKPVPGEILEKIVDSGRLAPTARGEEPWEFVVVTDRKTLSDLGNLADSGRFISSAGAAIAVFCKEAKYYIEDGSAASENMLIAATSLGVGSCWVAGDKKPYAGAVRERLGVPGGYRLVSLLSLGYSSGDVKPHPKRKLSEVLHWEKF